MKPRFLIAIFSLLGLVNRVAVDWRRCGRNRIRRSEMRLLVWLVSTSLILFSICSNGKNETEPKQKPAGNSVSVFGANLHYVDAGSGSVGCCYMVLLTTSEFGDQSCRRWRQSIGSSRSIKSASAVPTSRCWIIEPPHSLISSMDFLTN